jgi:hypothetical protein
MDELVIGKYHLCRLDGSDLVNITAGDLTWGATEEEIVKMLELGIEVGLNNKYNKGTEDE